jgi:long-chain fatty acid transport protein
LITTTSLRRASPILGVLVLVSASVSSPRDARAAGFALDVHGARPTGMGGAVTGFINDSSAIFFNPAGIAQGKILDAQAGVTLISPSFTYTNRSGESTTTDFGVLTPASAFVAGGITDALSLGIGFYTPFGSTLTWPDGWEGRRLITSISLRTFALNPTAAYRIGPVRIGAGFQAMRATVRLERQIAFGQAEGSVDLGAGTYGFGGNVGAQVEAIPEVLSFGAHYRSAVTLDFDGLADFENVPAPLQNAIHDQAVATTFVMPDTLALGAAVRPIKPLVLDADLVWYGWGSVNSVDLKFPDDQSGTLASSRPRAWNNVVNYRIGAEADVAPSWQVRGGLVYDPTPSPNNTLTPDSPDANRLNIAVGGSYLHERGIRVDLAYRLVVLFTREATTPELPGDYHGLANLLSFSVGYRTPRPKPSDPPR